MADPGYAVAVLGPQSVLLATYVTPVAPHVTNDPDPYPSASLSTYPFTVKYADALESLQSEVALADVLRVPAVKLVIDELPGLEMAEDAVQVAALEHRAVPELALPDV